MKLPTTSRLRITPDIEICRILMGMWQVSGKHGVIDPESAIQSMFLHRDAGFTTWMLADIYGPAEDLIGAFRKQLAAKKDYEALSELQAFTKWVPNPGRVNRKLVVDSISKSCKRMGMEVLDLLAFHWWDYKNKGYLDALKYLNELTEEGRIKYLGLTNFNTQHLQIILETGLNIVSHEVQFSLIDRRPEVYMIPFCKEHDIKLFTYGTLCGGFLSERYLGKPEPSGKELSTASQQYYKRMIDAWGNWSLFQELLNVLSSIADKHQAGISNIAARYILDKHSVAGVIVGVRLGIYEHRDETARVFNLKLDNEDLDRIHAVLENGNDLFKLLGDCGDEIRGTYK